MYDAAKKKIIFTRRDVKYILSMFSGLACFLLLLPGGAYFIKYIGPDDKYEIIRAHEVAAGATLYEDVWSDQPPLYTWVLGGAYMLLGYSPVTCRLVNLFTIYLLYKSLCKVLMGAGIDINRYVVMVVYSVMITNPSVVLYTYSNMLELPCIAVAFASFAILLRKGPGLQVIAYERVVLSGVTMGAAILIKLVAMQYMLLAWMYLVINKEKATKKISAVAIYTAITIAVSGLTLWFSGGMEHVYKTHLHAYMEMRLSIGEKYSVLNCFKQLKYIPISILGACVVIKNRNIILQSIAGHTLIVLPLLHAGIRPYWGYYYYHYIPGLVLLASVYVWRIGLLVNSRKNTVICMAIGTIILVANSGVNKNTMDGIAKNIEKEQGEIMAEKEIKGKIFTFSQELVLYKDVELLSGWETIPKKRYLIEGGKSAILEQVLTEKNPEWVLLTGEEQKLDKLGLLEKKYTLYSRYNTRYIYKKQGTEAGINSME